MANRYPLVINNSSTLVSEVQAGDNLNLSGSGIYDGSSTGSNGYVLSSTGSGVSWIRPAEVYLNDTQTITNKTLNSCTIDGSQNTLSNISNASLINDSITFRLTRDGINYDTEVSLGGTYEHTDTNDNTTYSISIAGSGNTDQEKIRLTAGNSGSGFQDVILSVDGNYLSIDRLAGDEVKISASLQTLTAGNYIIGSPANTYNGLTATTWSVNATPGTETNVGASKVVARNASGNFYANTITATLNGTATNVSNAVTFGTHLSAVLTGTTTSRTTFDGSEAITLSVQATSSNTANRIVLRNSNGDFSARNINVRRIEASSNITAQKFIKNGGTSDQFLKADGSVDDNSYFENVDTSNGYGERFISTSTPTGSDGSNGDLWYVI